MKPRVSTAVARILSHLVSIGLVTCLGTPIFEARLSVPASSDGALGAPGTFWVCSVLRVDGIR